VAPTTGTFAVGDFVTTQAGGIWICTGAGTPGTWAAVSGVGGMTNPMTTLDDIIVGGTVTGGVAAPGRLGKGTDGQVLTVDPTTHHLLWATPGSGSSPLTTKGDLHGFSTADARVPIGSDTQVLMADSSQALGLKWAAGGGGGITHSYVGYNSIGGTPEAWTNTQGRAKQIVLATAGVLLTIDFYIDQTANNVEGLPIAAVWADLTGTPGICIAASGGSQPTFFGQPPGTYTYTPRWLSIPIGIYLAAGTYWIGATMAGGSDVRLYYDGSGSDVTWSIGSGVFINDGGRWTNTVGSKKYSIRGSLIQ
jgi:hypothetical protein